MNVCEKCHDKIHNNIPKEPLLENPEINTPVKKKVVRKKTTKGYIVTETPIYK